MSEQNSRLSAYKKAGTSIQDLRRKRAELSVALRKQAREDQLLKRRALSPNAIKDEVAQPEEKLPSPSKIVRGLKSSDPLVATSSAQAARRILSREPDPPIANMVSAGVIAPLVAALDRDDCFELRYEAAWALTNVAWSTHEHTNAVIEAGAIPKLVALLYLGGSMAEQAAWGLGNIAGDGPAPRDAVLDAGALPALLLSMSTSAPASTLRIAVWACSNLCRFKNPLVNFDSVAPALPFVANLLELEDTEVLANACWAISFLTDGPNERIEEVQMTPNLLQRVVPLLAHNSGAVKTPALRAVGNMLTGTDVQSDRCLAAGCVRFLLPLMSCRTSALVKEATWAATNILAGNEVQIQRAIDEGMLPILIDVLSHEDAKCQHEAAWGITYMSRFGSPAQLDALMSEGFLEPYCGLLAAADLRSVDVVLAGLINLLWVAEKCGQVEPMCVKLEEIGALDKIEALQCQTNESIYNKTVHILDTYFAENEDQNAAPEQTNEVFQSRGMDQDDNINF